ncbi:bactofilin family protein [Paenibacillus sp. SYP-B4298]|uniref:bactofilin family protein n=1 Tax=Paenibacillus sp. SYP-B4298 TaxID=2996034 RepID=UPI0022DCEBDC|nr:polymer-forming cytoskeletal protein [Paenibacillus sp. SYP-B4298]
MFRESKQRATIHDTLIGQGAKAEGSFHCESGIRIEGEYQGEMICKGEVIVGEYGVCRSTISAPEVTIAGIVHGEVHTQGRLTITASGQLHGIAIAQSLVIHEGGLLNGTCRMEKQAPAKMLSHDASKERSDKDNGSTKDKKALQAG